MFSSRAKKKERSYCQVCVQWAHPKDKGWNVQPQAARSGCCAWHLGPLSHCRNWHGAGSSSKSQVLFYLSESTSDLSRRTPQRDLPLKAVCFPSLLFCHITPSERRERTMRLPGSLSFNWSMNVPPQDSTVWLHRRGYILWCSYIYFLFM